MSYSPTTASTQFFPKSLANLLVVVANSCDTDNAVASPHDFAEISDEDMSTVTFSAKWSDHLPAPLVPGSQECRRLTTFVKDFILSNSQNGVLVCASGRHYRFYEKWCYQFASTLSVGVNKNASDSQEGALVGFNNNVHVINTGQTSQDKQESFLRSVQRALRVVSAEMNNQQSFLTVTTPSSICALHVDVICCSSNPEIAGWLNQEHDQEDNAANKANLLIRFNKVGDAVAATATDSAVVGLYSIGSKISRDLLSSAQQTHSWNCFQAIESGCASSMDVLEEVGVHVRSHNKISVSGRQNDLLSNNNNKKNDNNNSLPWVYLGRSYARVGLMGNPSDQLHGKSMAVSIKNFWATVTVTENKVDDDSSSSDDNNAKISFVPHPAADDTENYLSIGALTRQVSQDGYNGGIRLLQATCKRFFEYTVKILSSSHNSNSNENTSAHHHYSVESILSAKKVFEKMTRIGFSIQYDTNVPRQVGLAGSSCIVSAAVKALLKCYQVSDCPHFLPMANRPTFVLDVEAKELGINAGLMDRVAQVFEGLNEMDFTDPAETERNGHAVYTRHPVSCLPRLHLAVALDPSDSGKIHATVRQRFTNGDAEVLDAVKNWVRFVDESVAAIENQQSGKISVRESHDTIRSLMNQNFDLRRKIYGDGCLGWKNLKMVEIARKHKAAAKFPGSGGAVLIATHPEDTNVEALAAELEGQGFSLVELELFEPKILVE